MSATEFHITIGYSPASDGWGFVGSVKIEEHECYRTMQGFTTPTEALQATQLIVGDALGVLLAGQEWRALGQGTGHAPTRQDLKFGLSTSDSRGGGSQRSS